MQKPKGYEDITDREQQIAYIRTQLTAFVESITTRDPVKRQFYICPFCGDEEHKNSTGGAFSIKGDRTHWKCFSCNKSGDIFDLIGYLYGYKSGSTNKAVLAEEFKKEYLKACELLNLDPDFTPSTDTPKEKPAIQTADEYFTEETCKGPGYAAIAAAFSQWREEGVLNPKQKGALSAGLDILEDSLAFYDSLDELFRSYGFLDSNGEITQYGRAQLNTAEAPKAPVDGKFKAYLETCHSACTEGSKGYEYLIGRGFTAESIERFHLGYDSTEDLITIPYGTALNYYVTRDLKPKAAAGETNFNKPATDTAGAEPVFYGLFLYSDNYCFVCESQLDALSIIQAGGYAIALGGTGNQKLINLINDKGRPRRCLILCLDNDDAGRRGQAELAEKLDNLGIPYIESRFSLDQYGRPQKDSNDLLRSNPELLKEDVLANIQAAKDHDLETGSGLYSVGEYQNLFKKHQTEEKQRISTGFNNLDRALYGGFMNELYILSADTSIGKSAISCCLAQNVAASGIDVLYYALEMGRDEFIARGASMISREQNKNPIPYAEILNYKWDERSQEFYRRPYSSYEPYVEEYMRRYGKHLYFIEGGFYGKTALDIANTAEEFKKDHGLKQLVIVVDYLQRLKADPEDRSQRDAMSITSAAVQVLGNLASQKHNTVIAISSISNAQKGEKITDAAGKYSGDIGYTGGILLGWNWHGYTDTKKQDEKDETSRICKERGYREMILEVLKQRSGERDNKQTLFYHPAYNYFTCPDPDGKARPHKR